MKSDKIIIDNDFKNNNNNNETNSFEDNNKIFNS